MKLDKEKMPYVICRSYYAGVNAGYLAHRDGQELTLLNARKIWYWEGAATLVQMASEGVSKPDKCKFSMVSAEPIDMLEVCEIFYCTPKAINSIQGVDEWKE